MVKIRTVIPANAKPGSSVIQVVHPKTGRPSRVRVPADSKPGQVIELELPDEPNTHASPLNPIAPLKETRKEVPTIQKSAPKVGNDLGVPTRISNPKKDSSPNNQTVTTQGQGNVAQTPPPTQLPMPPFGVHATDLHANEVEKEHLLPSNDQQKNCEQDTESTCCISCLLNPVRFFKAMC